MARVRAVNSSMTRNHHSLLIYSLDIVEVSFLYNKNDSQCRMTNIRRTGMHGKHQKMAEMKVAHKLRCGIPDGSRRTQASWWAYDTDTWLTLHKQNYSSCRTRVTIDTRVWQKHSKSICLREFALVRMFALLTFLNVRNYNCKKWWKRSQLHSECLSQRTLLQTVAPRTK